MFNLTDRRVVVFDLETTLIEKDASNDLHARTCTVYDVAWCWLGGEVRVDDDEGPLLDALAEADTVVAHNIDFDIAVLREMSPRARRLVDDDILQDDSRILPVDTMAIARLLNMPAALGELGPYLGVGEKMDITFKPVAQEEDLGMFQDDDVIHEDDAEYVRKRREYAAQDVALTGRALRAMAARVQPEMEWEVMACHTRVNGRGIAVDRDKLAAAIEMRTEAAARVAARFKECYGFRPTQDQVLLQWLKRNGHPQLESVRKAEVAKVRKATKSQRVRDLIDMRSEAASDELAKLLSVQRNICPDGRVRHQFKFAAAHTGRFSTTKGGVQMHNLVRPLNAKQKEALQAEGRLPHPYMQPGVARAVMTHASGHTLFISDFAQIELRIMLAFSGMVEEAEMLHAGGDLYAELAKQVYGFCDKSNRQLAKNTLLGAQYGAGAETLQRTLDLPTLAEATKLRDGLHDRFKGLKWIWNELENGARRSIRSADTGKEIEVGGALKVHMETRGNVLAVKLPSGRRICYRQVELDDEGLFTCADKGGRKKIGFGGFFLENVCQAIGRDYLAQALVRVSRDPAAQVVSHIHDEVIAEVALSDKTPETFKRLESLMLPAREELPDGLFLDCESTWSEDFTK